MMRIGMRSGVRVLSLVVGVSVVAGFVAGQVMRMNEKESSAASVNIEVTDNDQAIYEDQTAGTLTIARTSEVTIRDSEANFGYDLSAKILSTSSDIAGAVVSIYPTNLSAITSFDPISTCSENTPCILSAAQPTTILQTDTGNSATNLDTGESTQWIVTITMPAGTNVGDYILDIEYAEEAYTLLDLGVMQALTNEACPTRMGRAYDARDDQYYYVRKIKKTGLDGVGDLCWMHSDLRYGGDGNYDSAWTWDDDRYATTASNTTLSTNDDVRPLTMTSSGYFGGSTSVAYTVAGVADSEGSNDYTHTDPIHDPPTTNSFYGYHYNWCAAMGGQINACNETSTTGFNMAVSICPAGWRLPVGNGGEFAALNNEVNRGLINTDVGLRTNFLGVYAGSYNYTLYYQGIGGGIWSSTVNDPARAYLLYFDPGNILQANHNKKLFGFTVRCVRE